MSNENSTTNNPREKRSRSFSLSTYLSKSQVADVLYRHDKQIRAYAYIEHNKDVNEDGTLKERHIHLLLQLVNQSNIERVRRWFSGFKDNQGLEINTLGQIMHDIGSSFDYLTHNTEQAKADGKYQYSKDEIQSNDLQYFEGNTTFNEDNISLALSEMISGIPLQDVALKYGRDFIIHYQSIKMLYNDIQKQIGGVQL